MSTMVNVKEQDILGPDFCSKRPVFLTHVPAKKSSTHTGARSSGS